MQYLLFLVFRSAAMVTAMFPPEAAPVLGRIIGTLGRWLDPKHRKYAAASLKRTGLAEDVPAMVRTVYNHLGTDIAETVIVPRLLKMRGAEAFVRFERVERLEGELRRGKGVIAVTGHLGNWEIAGLALSKAGLPFNSLGRPIDNPHFERWLSGIRGSTGQRIVQPSDAVRAAIGVLKRREIVAILADQDARENGVVVDFLGHPASTTRLPALMSLKYGAPIVVFGMYRDGPLHHIVFTEPLRPEDYAERADAVRELTQAFTARIEDFIRARPVQWMWLHPRWRSVDKGRVAREDTKYDDTHVRLTPGR